VASLNEALTTRRKTEAVLLEEIQSLKQSLERKPPESEKNLSAFLASEVSKSESKYNIWVLDRSFPYM
jgi:hypothetical protein